ncbi:MAG: hypothetical protein U0704_11845 [Candidatus Eisenbacteria bacterium]
MSVTGNDIHERFAGRLADHLLDLLEADEPARVEAHARECEACGRLLAAARAARADWWEGATHPPVSALVALQARPEALPEPQRALVARHLETCAECREDAATLAGAPEPELVGAASVAAPEARSWWPAAMPYALVGSFAALLLVFAILRPQSAPEPAAVASPEVRQPSDPTPPAPSGVEPAPAVPAPAATAPVLEPVALASATRGVPAEPTTVHVPAGVREVSFTLPALFVPEGATLVVELLDARGSVLGRDELPAARALSNGGVRIPVARLASGGRVLRVAWFDDSTGSESREYPLVVLFH